MSRPFWILLFTFIVINGIAKINAQPFFSFPEIKLEISASQYSNLKNKHDQHTEIKSAIMFINGDSVDVKEIHDRGNNSMKFKRKSLSVELEKSFQVSTNNNSITLKKFNLISLSMDKNFWHNRWANLILFQQGLFPLYNTFCLLWINDEPQGIYLLVEKPSHYRTESKSPYMLRRGINHSITDEYFENELKNDAKRYRQQYLNIYSIIKSKKGNEAYEELLKIINLPMYFRWMAFNYLTMNGDYSDEVYLYIQPTTELFELIPWDFDDILKPSPHEGWALRNKTHPEKRIYSLEETLDRTISQDEILYMAYEKVLQKTMFEIDSALLSAVSNQVLHELEQLSHQNKVVNASLFMDRQPFDINQAKQDITISLDLLLKRRKWILSNTK